jgi:heat shock protein 4
MDTIKAGFQKEQLERTLNSLEAVARGAALQSAFLSPAFSTSDFKVEDYNEKPMQVVYGDVGSEETKTAMVFDKKSMKFPNKKTITFNNKLGNMQMTLKYANDDDVLFGMPSVIAQYNVPQGKLKHEGKDQHSYAVEYELENTLDQIPILSRAELVEKWQEEEKIAVKKPAPPKPAEGEKKPEDAPKEGEEQKPAEPETVQEYETKIKKKSTTTPLEFNFSYFGWLPDAITKFRETEDKLMKADRQYLDLKESKNNLETICYKYREWLEGKMKDFLEEQARQTIVAEMGKTVDWLYDAGAEQPIDEYNKRYNAFMQVLTPLKKRYIFHDEVGDRFKLFSECVAYVEAKLAEPERAHLTEEQRKQVNDKVQVVSQFMAALQTEINSKPKHQDPSTTLDEIDKKLRILKAECDPILNTPKPAPKEEKKEEAPK